jgi:exonuclease III
MYVITLASLNINAITSRTRVGMLTEFLRRHDIDILFMQEVTSLEPLNIPGYAAHHNIGASTRGTAILARSGILLKKITRVPSGRAIAAMYHNTLLINVYAPSATAQRLDRENLFNAELPHLLRPNCTRTIIGGNFNSVLQPADTTGHFNTSRALKEIVSGLALQDTWEQNPSQPMYTYHSSHGATRLDRLYMSADLLKHKTGAAIIPVAFSDHHSMTLRIQVNETDVMPRRRQYRWKMDPLSMHDVILSGEIRTAMAQWRLSQRFYTDTAQWWERCVKTHLPRLIRRVTRKNNDDHFRMENHLYECLNDILRSDAPEGDKRSHLQRYKAKIVRLHATRRKKNIPGYARPRCDRWRGTLPIPCAQNAQPVTSHR